MDSKAIQSTNVCRTCLGEASAYKSLLSKMESDDRTLCEVLSFITSVDISVSDKYPRQVCEHCFSIMCVADEFIKKCIQSESLIKNTLFDSYSVKNELNKVDSQTSDQNQDYMNFFNSETKVVEIPLIDNLDGLDSFKYNNLETIKEEDDDFSRDDLGEAPVEFNESVVTKTCVCGCVCTDDKELEEHRKECKPVKVEVMKKELEQQMDLKTDLHCPICKKKFEYWSQYATHLKTHRGVVTDELKKSKRNKKINGKLSLTCPECDEDFPDMTLLGLHIMNNHRFDTNSQPNNIVEKKFECSMCMRSFVRRKSLIAHIKTHEEKARRIFKCEACGREFHHQAHLDNHVVLVHSRDKGFTCDKCKKSFASEELLNRHMEGHKKQKNHECPICNRYFTMLSSLTEHMRTHTGEKPFLCSVCGKGFSQKNNMTQHMRRHQGLKPFKCEHCERRFVSKGEMESHARRHSGAHPFICDECGNGFTTSSSLTKHRRIHSGERPYACDLCNMSFAVLGTLKNHRRTHTGEKPYQCSHCEKAFIQRQDLISHIRCHTGERPFICTCCGQGFRKTSALKVHIKIHGKESMMMQP